MSFGVAKILLYAKVVRAQVLFMPGLLSFCAYLYAHRKYGAAWNAAFTLVVASALLFNLAVNAISEYRDCRKGIDDMCSPGTRYRLASGIVPQRNVLSLGIVFFVAASLCGFAALIVGNPVLLIPGVAAASIAFFYSERPFELKYHALGEVCVFVVYAPLLFSSCILALTDGIFGVRDLLFSVPFGLLTTNVVLANNIRDYEFEKEKNNTLAIKYGLKFAYGLLFTITHVAFLLLPLFVYVGILPPLSLAAFLAYPLIFVAASKTNSPKFVNVFGIMQVAFTLLICISLAGR